MVVQGRGELMSVRRLTRMDWQVLRTLRLRALSADGHSFLADPAQERGYSPQQWRSRCVHDCWFVVAVDGVDVGMAAVVPAAEPTDVPHVESMWVEPGHRALGIATHLVHHLEEQARLHGVEVLGVWVFDTNPAARRLYERLGYRPLDPLPRRQRLRDSEAFRADDRIEEELRKRLWSGSAGLTPHG